MKKPLCPVLLFVCLSLPLTVAAGPIVIDFENLLVDGDPVTTQYGGVTFANATLISAGLSLDEFEFPPYSGSSVIYDSGGPMTIAFDSPLESFGAFFTYGLPLTLTAFDAGDNVLGTVSSLFLSNLALSGDIGSSPNEWLLLASALGITSVSIFGSPDGTSFVMDDATLTPPTPVPEPATMSLLLTGVALLRYVRRTSRTE